MTAAIAGLAGESELEKAQFRAAAPKCASCHRRFDAFGMVLEPYDAVGRLRTADFAGRPIDASWTTTALPASVGGETVTSAAETGARARDERRPRSPPGHELHQLRADRSIPGRRQQHGSHPRAPDRELRRARRDRPLRRDGPELRVADARDRGVRHVRAPFERTVDAVVPFARRSFLAGIGGAFGLETLLRNMEAAAQGAGAPPRFLMMHWPVGTIRDQFIPSGSGASYTTSKAGQGPGYIISPFDTPELRPHTIILHGFNMDGIRGEAAATRTAPASRPPARARPARAPTAVRTTTAAPAVRRGIRSCSRTSPRSPGETSRARSSAGAATTRSATSAWTRTRHRRAACRTATKDKPSIRRAPAARSGRRNRSCRR